MTSHSSPERELSQHLIAELFAKTAEMIRGAHAWELDAIILHHDNQLVAIANATALILNRSKATQLAYEGRGYAVPPRQLGSHMGHGGPSQAAPSGAAAPAGGASPASEAPASRS